MGVAEDARGGELIRKGRFAVGNIDILLDLVAHLEPDPVVAFKQFPLNSFDAFSEKARPGRTETGLVEIRFELSGKPPTIVISDYHARGMNESQMVAIPTKIGSSEKRERYEQLVSGEVTDRQIVEAGYQAIGMYVYRRLCQYCLVISRHFEPGSPTFATILPRSHGEEYEVYREPKDRELPGTDVYLVGVDPKQWRPRDILRMKQIFRREFRPQLMATDSPVELWIIHDGIRERIMPLQFQGEKLSESVIHTEWTDSSGRQHIDPTHLELYYHPGMAGGAISVELGPHTIVKDIRRIEGLNVPPFNSGEIEGVVKPTFLIPDSPRTSFIKDPEGRFGAWTRDMGRFAHRLAGRLEERRREARSAEIRAFERNLQVALKDVFNEYDLEVELRPAQDIEGEEEGAFTPGSGRRRLPSATSQEVRDEWKEWIWSLLDEGVRDIREIQKRIKQAHRVTLDLPRIQAYVNAYDSRGVPRKPTVTEEERQRRAELVAGFSLLFQPIWSEIDQAPVRSRFDASAAIIQINPQHPEYAALQRAIDRGKRGEDSRPLNRYITELVVKELAPRYYSYVSDPSELYERVMDLRGSLWARLGLA